MAPDRFWSATGGWASSSRRWRRSTAARSPASSTSRSRPDRDRAPATSAPWMWRSISRCRTRCRRTVAPAARRDRSNVVIGTTGWQRDEPALRELASRDGIGVLASANFSIGMDIFRAVVRGGGAAVRADRRRRRLDPRVAPRRQEGRAVRHGADAARRRWSRPATRGRSTSRPRAPGSIPGTHVVGFDAPAETVTLTHDGPRPRGVRARRARGGEVAERPARLVHDGRTCWRI